MQLKCQCRLNHEKNEPGCERTCLSNITKSILITYILGSPAKKVQELIIS